MATILKTIRVDASAEDAWSLVGDLEAMPEWVPGVAAAQVTDGKRVSPWPTAAW